MKAQALVTGEQGLSNVIVKRKKKNKSLHVYVGEGVG